MCHNVPQNTAPQVRLSGKSLRHCRQLRGSLACDRGRLDRHCDVEQITPASRRPDQAVVVVAELLAQFPDALKERVIAYGDVGPRGFEKLLFGHEPPGMLNKIAEYLERLGAQVDLLIADAQTSAR
jgi:hypothetical protein